MRQGDEGEGEGEGGAAAAPVEVGREGPGGGKGRLVCVVYRRVLRVLDGVVATVVEGVWSDYIHRSTCTYE